MSAARAAVGGGAICAPFPVPRSLTDRTSRDDDDDQWMIATLPGRVGGAVGRLPGAAGRYRDHRDYLRGGVAVRARPVDVVQGRVPDQVQPQLLGHAGTSVQGAYVCMCCLHTCTGM